jgi:hypothetical protein
VTKLSDWVGTAKTAAASAFSMLDSAYRKASSGCRCKVCRQQQHGFDEGSLRYAEAKLVQALTEVRLVRYAQVTGYGVSFLDNEGEAHADDLAGAVKTTLERCFPVESDREPIAVHKVGKEA